MQHKDISDYFTKKCQFHTSMHYGWFVYFDGNMELGVDISKVKAVHIFIFCDSVHLGKVWFIINKLSLTNTTPQYKYIISTCQKCHFL